MRVCVCLHVEKSNPYEQAEGSGNQPNELLRFVCTFQSQTSWDRSC